MKIKLFCVRLFAILAAVAGPSAYAAERIITVDGVFAKDLFYPLAFGSSSPSLPVDINIVFDDEVPDIGVVAGTELTLIPVAAVTSLTATIGNATWEAQDLVESLFANTSPFGIVVDGPLDDASASKIGLHLRNFNLGEIQLVRFDATGEGLTGVGFAVDYLAGAAGSVSDVNVSFSTVAPTVSEQLSDLRDQLTELGLNSSLIDSIYVEDDANKGQLTSAVNKLLALIQKIEAQRGKKLTDSQVEDLVTRAQAIIDQLVSGN
jgi:hypothetical protein